MISHNEMSELLIGKTLAEAKVNMTQFNYGVVIRKERDPCSPGLIHVTLDEDGKIRSWSFV